MRILIIKLSSLGDIIHTLPCLSILRKAFSNAHIDWVTEELGASLLSGHPYIDNVIIYKRYIWPSYLKRGMWLRLINEVRAFLKDLRRQYDIVLDFQGLLKSGIITALAKGKREIGFKGKEFNYLFLKEKVPVNYNEHAVIRYLRLIEYLGIPIRKIEFPLPYNHKKWDIPKPFVVISPLARWESKLWFKERWIALTKELEKIGYKVVFIGSMKDEDYIGDICRDIPSAINLSGKTSLKELACLYREATLTISVDTGPMHLAAAVGTPVIALFGPTDPNRTGPFGGGHRVIYHSLPCQPCLKRYCPTRLCLKAIEVEEVVSAVKEILG